MKKTCITAKRIPAPVNPYSHAVAAGNLLFVSGQVPAALDGSGILHATFEEEARLSLENLKVVLEDAGSSLDAVVKVSVFLADMGNFAALNQVYRDYFPADFPARTCIQAGGLPAGVQIEVEAIALLAEA